MRAHWSLLASSVLALAGSAPALAQDNSSFRIGRAADWNLSSADGVCRLRVWVDDRAEVQMRGDEVIVRTESGQRSFDRGSVCNQPLPQHRVEDFRVTAERGRGAVFDVRAPSRRNDFTGQMRIDDPQNGGDEYDIVVAWRNPGAPPAPLVAAPPLPVAPPPLAAAPAVALPFDETRACQDRVRAEFLARNREGDAYLEFTGTPLRDDLGPSRERITGEAWARNRSESRPLSYECVVNDRTNRVLSAAYELRGRPRVSVLQ